MNIIDAAEHELKRWKRSIYLIVVALAMSPVMAWAEDKSGSLTPTEFPIPEGVKTYTYYSEIMKRDYEIIVQVPTEYYDHPDRVYPTLFTTDGAYHTAAAAMAQNYSALKKPMIVVSIGTPREEPRDKFLDKFIERRIFEFSLPRRDLSDKFGQEVLKFCDKFRKKPATCIGGAPIFLRFINEELLSGLSEIYRIDSDDLTLSGYSAGGFFAAWAIFQKNTPFKNYIIASPGMAYGDDEIYRLEEAYAATHEDLNVGIYISSGSLEMSDPFMEGVGRMVSGQAQLSAVLKSRQYPSLRLTSEIHHGTDHSNSALPAYIRGLRLLYGKDQTE